MKVTPTKGFGGKSQQVVQLKEHNMSLYNHLAFFPNNMTVDFYEFSCFMKDGISCYVKGRLIVTKKKNSKR